MLDPKSRMAAIPGSRKIPARRQPTPVWTLSYALHLPKSSHPRMLLSLVEMVEKPTKASDDRIQLFRRMPIMMKLRSPTRMVAQRSFVLLRAGASGGGAGGTCISGTDGALKD